jgi:hypothetical protein
VKPTIAPSGGSSPTATLSAGSPTGRINVTLPDQADSVVVSIISISNPRQQALVLRVSVEGMLNGQTVEVPLGIVSPFPADQPADFALPVPVEAERLIEASGGRVNLVIELGPADRARPLGPPLEMVVGTGPPAS